MCYLPNSWGISNEVLSIKPVFTEWGQQASGWTWYLPWNLSDVSPEISALRRQRKVGAYKFGANLVYRVHFRPTWTIYWVPSQINNNKTTTKLQSIAPGSYDTAPLGQEAWNICALWLQRRLPNNPAWAEPDFCWALYKLTASTRHSWELNALDTLRHSACFLFSVKLRRTSRADRAPQLSLPWLLSHCAVPAHLCLALCYRSVFDRAAWENPSSWLLSVSKRIHLF